MKIAHFSDTHLGFSRYAALDERGLNQRMVDVVETFQRVLDSILASEAEVVIHAGDFFDKDRPQNLIITGAYKRLVRFQRLREGRPLILIAGNHDSPKTIGVGNILRIFGEADQSDYSIPGVYVVESKAHRIVLPDFKVEALTLPYGGESPDMDLRPSDRRNTSALVAHGIENSLNVPGATLSLSRMNYGEWDYVALGDYHIRKELAENVWYCGSTDYTSSNFWDEGLEKGWNLFDSETREVKFVPVEPARAPVPLPDIDATDLSGQEIGDRMVANAHWDDASRPMVRQAIRNCDAIARTEIPQSVKAELQERAFHYQLDIFLAKRESESIDIERGASLEEEWSQFAENRTLPLGIEREEFKEAGHRLMKETIGDSS